MARDRHNSGANPSGGGRSPWIQCLVPGGDQDDDYGGGDQHGKVHDDDQDDDEDDEEITMDLMPGSSGDINDKNPIG